MSYIGNEPIVSATRTVTEITATAGQTVFTANGGYTVGYLDVFVNGAQLQNTDFTATNGSTVTLSQAAQSGDDIRLVAWGTFQSANAVALVGNSNLTGNLNVSGNLGVGTTSPVSIAGKFVQLGNQSSVSQLDVNGDLYLGNNLYYDGTNWRYLESGEGGFITIGSGIMRYYSAPSGSAGATATISERSQVGIDGQQSSTIVGFSGVYNEYKCRAWVNFNGTGTVAIRASGNVSSITDNGVGLYEVNLTTAMPDTNYSVVACGSISFNNFAFPGTGIVNSSKAYVSFYSGAAFTDLNNVYVVIHR